MKTPQWGICMSIPEFLEMKLPCTCKPLGCQYRRGIQLAGEH